MASPAPAASDVGERDPVVKMVPSDVVPRDTFDAMDFNSMLHQNIRSSAYTTPSCVQRHALPVVLAGRDLVACTRSGSGKMAACVLPALQIAMARMSPAVANASADGDAEGAAGKPGRPTSLILTPIREFAGHLHQEAMKFMEGTSLRCVVLFGGTPKQPQLDALQRGVDIIFATPGRLLDLVRHGAVSFSNIQYVGFYEAERMLDMGFEPQLMDLLDNSDMPPKGERQTVMYAAVFKEDLRDFARRILNNPTFLQVGGINVDHVTQNVIWVEEDEKRDALSQYIHPPAAGDDQKTVMVFAATTRVVEELKSFLADDLAIAVTSLTGNQTTAQRGSALELFKSGQCRVLIATDLPTRGLKLAGVSAVIQYDMAGDVGSYLRRIGHAGDVFHPATTVTFVNEKDAAVAKELVALLEESKQNVPDQLRAV